VSVAENPGKCPDFHFNYAYWLIATISSLPFTDSQGAATMRAAQ
jgi:hypothetical protein